MPRRVPTHSVSTQSLGIGVHTLTVAADDGINEEMTATIVVEIVDGSAPTLNPLPSRTILWPPNHEMVEVTIESNAADNSGDQVVLAVAIASSEPADASGDGSFLPDYVIDEVVAATGLIRLHLRAERAGRGDGRIYTITIVATDGSGHVSTATAQITAPHDRRSK